MACNAQRIRQGTTPLHTFTLPFEVDTVATLSIVYNQGGRQVLRRTGEGCELEGNTIKTRLTQEESFSFSSDQPVEIQVRVLTTGGDALTSNIMRIPVAVCLDDEVLV